MTAPHVPNPCSSLPLGLSLRNSLLKAGDAGSPGSCTSGAHTLTGMPTSSLHACQQVLMQSWAPPGPSPQPPPWPPASPSCPFPIQPQRGLSSPRVNISSPSHNPPLTAPKPGWRRFKRMLRKLYFLIFVFIRLEKCNTSNTSTFLWSTSCVEGFGVEWCTSTLPQRCCSPGSASRSL